MLVDRSTNTGRKCCYAGSCLQPGGKKLCRLWDFANANQILEHVNAMMTNGICPATKIQKIEQELWTLNLKGDDIEAYNDRFHKLVLMCPELVSTESKKIEKYIRGFPKRIKGKQSLLQSFVTLNEAINMP
ncbi:putative reverse transcriptase domain-containing protein [Tanacetum coccineum]|uniref:Reverse transcriptase domain-containing protein n=1 Tax=Tanacetum coccineum TaxID=301880 RepID=A0ABQ5GEL9_9ASTR